MMEYLGKPTRSYQAGGKVIYSFTGQADRNIDDKTVDSFGDEWENFHDFDNRELTEIGNEYFDMVTPDMLSTGSVVLDVGTGSGRWAKYLAGRVAFVEAVDPGRAVFSAAELTKGISNIRITQAGVGQLPFPDNSFDFVFSLGVLHHIPDTTAAMQACVDKLKPGGYFLVYLYYNLDNRGRIYKFLFRATDRFRRLISSFPRKLKKMVCDGIAVFIYWPLARFSRLMKLSGFTKLYRKIPLSYYHDKSFYIIRNDALDRFGTPLEKRFSKMEIRAMMEKCGLENIVFSDREPYWHATGRKK